MGPDPQASPRPSSLDSLWVSPASPNGTRADEEPAPGTAAPPSGQSPPIRVGTPAPVATPAPRQAPAPIAVPPSAPAGLFLSPTPPPGAPPPPPAARPEAPKASPALITAPAPIAAPGPSRTPSASPGAPRGLVAAPPTAAPTTSAPTTAAPPTVAPPPPRTPASPKVVPPVSTNGSGNVFVAAPVQARSPFTAAPTATTAPEASSTVVRDVTVVRRRRGWRLVLEWGAVLLVALAVAFGIRTFVVQTFFIPSASMEPTLKIGDRILVDKLSYRLHGVHRGDIVVFGKPPGENDPTITDLVKRVIGLPGDTIASQDGKVYIDGKPLNESYLPAGTVTTGITPQTIPPNEYFVMGDNRSDSQDSRYFGPISKSLIVGRVVVRIWPLSALHIF